MMQKGDNSGVSRGIFGNLTRSREFPILVILAVICVIMSIITNSFARVDNLFTVAKQISMIVLIALGETLVIVAGGFDLSVGSIAGFTGVMMSLVVNSTGSGILGILVSLSLGCTIGAINGVLITKVGINPFIVTLGMMNIVRGTVTTMTKGLSISVMNDLISAIGQGYVGPVPIPVIIMIFFVIVFHILYSKTIFGSNIKAIGGNQDAARISGIKIDKNKILIFIISGAMSALAGIIMVGRINTGQPIAGQGWEIDAIAAAIVGGTALSGGQGTILGTLIGAALIGVMSNAMVLMSVSMYFQQVFTGLVLIGVVAIDTIKNKMK
ncbi:MAG: ABC transporter permease [Treponema sp.]|jgi:ribose transport system permease protein|nr:ABC transporter permease [Treponema sp.]